MSEPDNTILHELLALQKESNERDSRIEVKMDSLSTRMTYMENHADKQDKQIEKLTDILSEQKTTTHNIDTLTAIVNDHNNRITKLENAGGQIAISLWKKIGIIALTCIVTAIVGFFIGKVGLN